MKIIIYNQNNYLFERLEAALVWEPDTEDPAAVRGLEGVRGPGLLHQGEALGGAGRDQEAGADPALKQRDVSEL